jgi:hypothetical protein
MFSPVSANGTPTSQFEGASQYGAGVVVEVEAPEAETVGTAAANIATAENIAKTCFFIVFIVGYSCLVLKIL